MTRPDVSNSEPWHGQTYEFAVAFETTHASCVHCAVTATNDVALVRVTRKFPAVDVTSAMPPVAASGELAPMFTVMAPLVMAADMVGSGDPGIELAGFPPPHAGSRTSPPAQAASRAQNSRLPLRSSR